MNKKLTLYCISSLVLGSIIYTCQFLNLNLPQIINNYLNDFLIIPVLLFICLLFLRWSRNESNFRFKIGIILYVCLMYSILFEFIFPNYLARYTKDYLDIILYFASGFIFYILQNKSV